MNHDEWLDRADAYGLGALEPDEVGRFEAHIAGGCRPCAHRLGETREAITLVARSLPPLEPPPGVRARLMARIAAEVDWAGEGAPAPPPRPRPAWIGWGGWAAALAAAGLLVAVSWNLSTTREEVRDLTARVAALQADLARRQTELAQREETLRFLFDPQVRYVNLAGLPASPQASGWLLWNPVSRAGLLMTQGLPASPADRAYELWALAGGEPVPAGVFTVDPAGRALLRLPPLPEGMTFDKFAVTLEPAGGVPKPTGPMHLLGSL